MKPEQAWQAALGQLQMEMPRASFDTWVRDSELISYEDGVFVVGTPNAYARDWLDSRLSSTIIRLLTGIMNRTVGINFVVWQDPVDSLEEQSGSSGNINMGVVLDNQVSSSGVSNPSVEPDVDSPEYDDGTNSNSPGNGVTLRGRTSTLNPRYTFENFVVGGSNRLAHAASMAVAERPAHAYNPLFVYGGVGMGKTHLLHAIGNHCERSNLQVLYVSSEEFTNDLVNAIRTHTTQAFREKYRRIDVLLIDDIQFIAGKESTQEEFFHTFNTLHGQNKQIVMSSDRPPKALVTLEERLRSRFEWGLTADIQPADFETRLAILRSKAERSGYHYPDEILETIARRFQSNIRELEGALTRIMAFANLSGLPITSKLLDSVLADMLPRRRDVKANDVVRKVADTFGIPMERMLSKDRSREVALPRQIAMYLLHEEANISLPQIGEALGGRDHTTILYGCEKVADLLERDDRIRRQVIEIKEQLYGRSSVA